MEKPYETPNVTEYGKFEEITKGGDGWQGSIPWKDGDDSGGDWWGDDWWW